jgi:hypothetical protein
MNVLVDGKKSADVDTIGELKSLVSQVPATDSVDPVITITTGVTTVTVGNTYTDAGATAKDNVDGDITKNIKTSISGNTNAVGTITVTYTVSDAAGNDAKEVRTVNVVAATVADKEVPTITLLGDETVNLVVGDTYIDAGATAYDNIDGNITSNIEIVNDVNASNPGNYTVKYNVLDDAKNPADVVTRTVNVYATQFVGDTDTVTDIKRGLVWDKTASLADSCATPKAVPTIEQFQTIIDYTKSAPAVVDGFDLATDDIHYKTSDGWDVRLKYGIVKAADTATKTICVDATSEVNTTRVPLERNATNNTVTDPNTGLVWADTTVSLKTFTNATGLCTGEMRLPTVIELDSIYDRENNKTVAPFKSIHNGAYWTSTEAVADTTQNWTVAFDDVTNKGAAARIGRITGQDNSSGTAFFRCVKKAD